jgi:CBS domain containing-hemolysin-like protein
MGIIIGLVGLFFLLDIFIAIVRAALLNVRVPQLVDLGTEQPQKVEQTIQLLEKPRLRAAFRFLVGLIHFCVAAGVVAMLSFNNIEMTMAGWVGVFALVLLVLLGFEFLFERLPLRNPEKWALALTPVARVLDWIISPVSATLIRLQGTDNLSPRQFGSVSEDELKTWVEVGQPEGGLEADERRMIYSIFQFGDTLCREIMVPRIDVLALEVKTPLNQAINLLVESGHSRVPVYDDSIDNVIGLLYAKDLLKLQASQEEKPTLRKYLRPAYYVPETKMVDDLLAEMQAKGVHIAIVVDEYGGMAGLVTLEDIVEEIVGEIRDEYDQKEEVLVQKINDDEFIFKARVSLDDFNDALGTEVSSEQTDTLGGILYGNLGRVPLEGDTMHIDDWLLTIEEVRGRRIGKIRAERQAVLPDEEAENATEP